ncbi:CoA-binding protein Ecym_1145 [Eremothecium cymbalariae DBVPG|uniref:CoA-binding domain-containing protein n=1 Tax=Eremothecium cymbalariae (strain CBS 270.75 / DBVPG 7215 / KCTC 17166 / NRRL Y-17582) TaxID=931890 RepID=G8JMP2_ERECY|nr:hypothetical protein Ecym_1145 [Eremothecium cymbalariae DBVPG\
MKQVLGDFFSEKRLYFVCGKVYQDGHFANRIVHWFLNHELPVVPVSPKGGEMQISNKFQGSSVGPQKLKIATNIATALKEVSTSQIDGISVNFVTPPQVTLSIQQQLRELNVPVKSVWFQPGSWNIDCINYAREQLQIEPNKVISDCILVNGNANYKRSTLKL